ncbi:LamG domain-containing protein, partial [Planctomycetota bacterium]
DPNVPVTVTWSVTDAAQAAHVSIDDASVLDPNVTFDDPNLYSLTLSVDDGTSVETDTVLIKVKLAGNALQAHWKFDGDVDDPNDYDNNWTSYTGSPSFGPGLVGDAMILKPSDSTSYGKGIGAETSISVAFWMKPASDFASDGTGMIRKYSGTSSDLQGGWSFQMRDETQMRWRCSSGWDAGAGDLRVDAAYPVDVWTHIVGTYDGETGDMTFYVNGQLTGDGNSSDTSFDSFIDEMTVGSDNFAGMVDDLYLFDYVLNADEVRTLVEKGKSLPPAIQVQDQVKILLPTTEVQLTATVTDGMGSLTSAWTVLDKPDGATVTLSDLGALDITVQVDLVGNYRLGLTVTDQATPLQSDSAEVVIKVRPEDYDGLEAHITFADQTADSKVATSVSYVGEIFGDPQFIEGKNGEGDYCILMDGVDDHVNYNAYLGSDPCCTIAYWIGHDAVGVDSHPIQKWPSDMSGKGWMFRNRINNAPGQIAFMIGSGFNGGGAYYQTDIYVPAVAWTHIAMTFDGTEVNLYLNGALAFTDTEIDGNYTPGDLVTPMVIGYRENNESRFFKGAMDEVRIYDYALSAEALEAIYKAEGGE